jgi:hypothetical protein
VVFCAWKASQSEQISSLWKIQKLLQKLQFSEVVMKFLCEVASGIIRDNSGFILKRRGELHQYDSSWTLAMLKSRLVPLPTTKASWSTQEVEAVPQALQGHPSVPLTASRGTWKEPP